MSVLHFIRPIQGMLLGLLLAGLAGPVLPARAQAGTGTETMADRTLRGIVERQKALLAEMDEASKKPGQLDVESFRTQLESLVHEYDLLLQQSPDFAAGYASYGYLLSKLDMRKAAMAALLKADRLDPSIALVKNELGNFLAEDGKVLEAADYYRAAMKLAPSEPLYPYQLGTLLYEGRDIFMKEGGYTRADIDREMQDAFRRAAELAPNQIAFTYRYAESFYDLAQPKWDEAYRAWAALEAKARSPIERETMILHEANVRLKQDRPDEARALLAQVTLPQLQDQRQKLVAKLPETARK
ncbi:MAG: hypothetical protein ACREFX_00720 [Opitutaceae bacterium]